VGAPITVMIAYSLARIGKSVLTTTLILAGGHQSCHLATSPRCCIQRELRRATAVGRIAASG
jgi:hypothetical protein